MIVTNWRPAIVAKIGLVTILILLIIHAAPAAQGYARAIAPAPDSGLNELLAPLAPDSGDNPARISSALFRLAMLGQEEHWSEAEEYARELGLKLSGRRVRVVVEAASPTMMRNVALARGMDLEVEATYRNRVQALVPITALRQVAAWPEVRWVRLPYRPLPLAVTSQGVAYTGADDWHSAGYSGSGVKVAVFDVGFAGYSSLIGSGDLPTAVITQSFRADGDIEAGEWHGSACAEIIYDMAPGAQLYLFNFDTDVELGNAVDYAISQGIEVASSSIGWFGAGLSDGSGPICDIVDDARNHGIFWAQSAGNAAQVHWEGPWVDANGNTWHDFASGDEGQTFYVDRGETIVGSLVWNDPWGGSGNDYDLYLFDGSGAMVARSTDLQDGSGYPSELIDHTVALTESLPHYLAIRKAPSASAVHLELYSNNPVVFQYQVPSSSLMVPADAAGAVAAGAVDWQTSLLEPFSSRGPANDGRAKPEFAGPDAVSSATLGPGWLFGGTSAAAPHLAGAAALVRSAHASYSVTDTVTFLAQRAVDLGSAGRDNLFGYGAVHLGAAPLSTPTPTASATPSATTSATPSPTATATPSSTASASPTATHTPSPTTTTPVQTTLVLQQGANGYVGAEDTYIWAYDEPGTTHHLDSRLKVGDKARNAALLRFDLAPIPPASTITAARLELWTPGWSGAGAIISTGPYAISRTVSINQVTWTYAQSGNAWGTAGCESGTSDRRPHPESSSTINTIFTWYSFDVTALVQAWVSALVPNNGVLIRTIYADAASYYFASAEDGTVANRPRLIVTYGGAAAPTQTATPSATYSATPTPTHTATPSATPSATSTPSATHTATPTPTLTSPAAATATASASATATLTPTGSATPTPTPTHTATTVAGSETTITLQQGVNGYSGAEDTYIWAYDDPGTTHHLDSRLKLGDKARNAALIRFALTPIPYGATINAARLELWTAGWSGAGATITANAYAVIRSVTMNQTTWTQAQTGNNWSVPGCNGIADRRSAPESSSAISSLFNWFSFDVTALLQDWVNGLAPNNGILIRSNDIDAAAYYFASAEDGTVANRPRLIVTYGGVAAPTHTTTPTATPTPSTTRTPSPTATHAATPSPTATATSTPSATHTPSPTPTATLTPDAAATPTPSATATPTLTPTGSATPTPTYSATFPAGSDTTITLQQGVNGYSGAEDTYLYVWAPTINYSAQNPFTVGDKQRYAAVVRFDLSSIPADSSIVRAALQIYAVGWSNSDMTMGAYFITRTTTIRETTWDLARAGYPWGSPGCNDITTDRRPTPGSTVTTSGPLKWYEFDVTSFVQNWTSGTANNGILLRGSSNVSGRRFYLASAESPTVEQRPRLIVTYRQGGAPVATSTPSPTLTNAAGNTVTPTSTSTPTSTATSTLTPMHTPTASTTAPPSGPITVTLQQGSNGYSGAEDTYIDRYQSAPYSALTALKVGSRQIYAALLRFDLSTIPSNAVITMAQLQVYATGWSGSEVAIATHAVIRAVTFAEATWSVAQTGYPWGVAGCEDTSTDRRASLESMVTATGPGRWYEFGLTSLVQSWVNGTALNRGILLRATRDTYTGSFQFASAEHATSSLRPKLVISYYVSTGPTPTTTPYLIIGHITDIHVGGTAIYNLVVGAFQSISQQAHVMVDTGDYTEHGSVQETLDYWTWVNSYTTIPWRAVIGNHDNPDSFSAYIGPLDWSWDVGGYRLIGINMWNINYAALDGALTMEKPCIIFGHLPLEYYSATDQAQLRQRFAAYQVRLYVSGHTHVDSLTTDPASGTLLLVGRYGSLGSYRLITLRGGEVDVQF